MNVGAKGSFHDFNTSISIRSSLPILLRILDGLLVLSKEVAKVPLSPSSSHGLLGPSRKALVLIPTRADWLCGLGHMSAFSGPQFFSPYIGPSPVLILPGQEMRKHLDLAILISPPLSDSPAMLQSR